MSKEKRKIIELCNSNLEGKDLIIAIEEELAKMRPYNHNCDEGLQAVGLYEPIRIDVESEGAISNCVEAIEKSVTKRELAVCVAKYNTETKVIGNDGNELPDELKDLLDAIIGRKRGTSKRSIESECKEEDDSECWKCRKKPSCTKFKGFNAN